MHTRPSFQTLYTRDGLSQIDMNFHTFLKNKNPDLYTALQKTAPLSKPLESTVLLQLAPALEDFLGELFQITAHLNSLRTQAQTFSRPPKRTPYKPNLHDMQTKAGTTPRQGFACHTPSPHATQSLVESHGCLVCHERHKDTCAQGFPDPQQPDGWRHNAAIPLKGCPLGQKISEMHALRQRGRVIGALAMIMVDNPLVALSGLRICVDCETACIFQKHEPIHTPAVETEILTTVLNLPWGFEIYSLLSRWNPLNLRFPLPKAPSGYSVCVAGLGPAGLTLAHYLLQEGHCVYGIDGLKIEPLPALLLNTLIEDVQTLWIPLEERIPQGIGGVAEYGITTRWDKNFLTLVRLLLERRPHFLLRGGVRLGSSLTPQDIFEAPIDHLALCLGAGRPHIPSFLKTLPQGVRMASDFLMTLSLGVPFQEKSPVALQIELPVVVIGGGLTAIDAATEALAFYPRQMAKFRTRDQKSDFHPDDAQIVAEFRRHSDALHGLSPQEKLAQIQNWGGVTLLYRRDFEQSPSFRLNPAEVAHALAQGVRIRENDVPLEILEEKGKVTGVRLENGEVIAAKTVLLATGTFPNTVIFEEFPGLKHDTRVSQWGDLDPSYTGSVVQAMASAKNGFQHLTKHLQERPPVHHNPLEVLEQLNTRLHNQLLFTKYLKNDTLSLTFHAPLAQNKWRPEQFFKIQKMGQPSEGIAMQVAERDPDKGTLTFLLKEVGASTRQLFYLKPSEQLMLMGPLGETKSDTHHTSVKSPMQCMMHQICAQCLQIRVNPDTQETHFIYACQFPQGDPAHRNAFYEDRRLCQNRVMERALWSHDI